LLSKSTKLTIRVYCKEIFGDDDPLRCLALVASCAAFVVLAYCLSVWSGIPINFIVLGISVIVLLCIGADFKSIMLIVMMALLFL